MCELSNNIFVFDDHVVDVAFWTSTIAIRWQQGHSQVVPIVVIMRIYRAEHFLQ